MGSLQKRNELRQELGQELGQELAINGSETIRQFLSFSNHARVKNGHIFRIVKFKTMNDKREAISPGLSNCH